MRFLGFDSRGHTKFLEFTYMVTIALLLLAVVFTPVFIRHHFLLFKKYVIQEDAVEAGFIVILLLIAYLSSNIYKKELQKFRRETRRLSKNNSNLSSRLTDAFKYIGGVNVQLKQFRSIFCGPRRYPATENAFKKELALFARNLLGIVNADWILIRIICQTNLRTVKEHLEHRKDVNFLNKGISNKAIVANRSIDGYSIVASCRENSQIMGVCVFPKKNLEEEEKVLVEVIINQIEMLYLIYASYQPHEIFPIHNAITRDHKKIDHVKEN